MAIIVYSCRRAPSATTAIMKRHSSRVRGEFEEKLATLVEIPSISMDPECTGDIKRCGEAAAEFLRGIGAKVQVVSTPGNPVVFGSLITDKNNPTVTIYNHLDVQPADA